jgi:hypothetical protein
VIVRPRNIFFCDIAFAPLLVRWLRGWQRAGTRGALFGNACCNLNPDRPTLTLV